MDLSFESDDCEIIELEETDRNIRYPLLTRKPTSLNVENVAHRINHDFMRTKTDVVLMFFVQTCIPGNTLYQQIMNAEGSNGYVRIQYTLTYRNSSTFKRLLRDEDVTNSCNIYLVDVEPPLGCRDIALWIARMGIRYICHSKIKRFPSQKVEFEFLLDRDHHSLVRHYVDWFWTRPEIEKIFIGENMNISKLFCYMCSESCALIEKEWHISIYWSKKVIVPSIGSEHGIMSWFLLCEQGYLASQSNDSDDLDENFQLCTTPVDFLIKHPVKIPSPQFSNEDGWPELYRSVNISLDRSPDEYACAVYGALVIDNPDHDKMIEFNLPALWKDEFTYFGLYIGLTKELDGIRKGHFIVPKDGFKSSIAKKLTKNARTFLVYHTKFKKNEYQNARKLEAMLIMILVERFKLRTFRIWTDPEPVNIRPELQPLYGLSVAEILDCAAFISSNVSILNIDGVSASTDEVYLPYFTGKLHVKIEDEVELSDNFKKCINRVS